MTQVKSATVLVMIGAGSRYETRQISGLSHFLEHMAFKGTKKRPSSLAISSAIDAIGGEFNAFTSKDQTGFYIKAQASHLPLLIDVLSDMLLNSLFKEEEIEREKGVIIEEINMYQDTPMRHISDIYEELIFGDHPLGWNIAGSAQVIRKINRADFMTYLDGLYRPNNCVIVVAGGIKDKTETVKLVEQNLASWEAKKIWKWQKNFSTQKKSQMRLEYKDTEQAHIAVGVRAYPHDHPKEYAQSVLTAILGGGMSSRLFIQVRERRGLAYYVRSDSEHYLDTGGFVTQAGVQIKKIEEAISVIINEYFSISEGRVPINKQELTKAKEYLKGRLILELEDSRAVSGLYGTQEILKKKIKTPEEIIARTEKVTSEEVVDVAREIFHHNKLNLAIIGPYKEEEKFLKLIS